MVVKWYTMTRMKNLQDSYHTKTLFLGASHSLKKDFSKQEHKNIKCYLQKPIMLHILHIIPFIIPPISSRVYCLYSVSHVLPKATGIKHVPYRHQQGLFSLLPSENPCHNHYSALQLLNTLLSLHKQALKIILRYQTKLKPRAYIQLSDVISQLNCQAL